MPCSHSLSSPSRGDAAYDEDASVVYFNTHDSNDATGKPVLPHARLPAFTLAPCYF